jgi:DHA1 family bicyclomycin/chloramphenicol resistance-like MFS transporter
MTNNKSEVRFEFVALMASMMSIVALSIDAILPAMSIIGEAVGSQSSADNQLFIIMIFLGLGFGQLLFGPLSDSFGRKPIVYSGLGLFFIGSIVCIYAPSFEWMVIGRLLQGIGLSAPRTISISIVRDSYKGDYMAKIMSFVMVIFILVPVIAPMLGKWILNFYNWQAIFYFQLVFAVIVMIWFGLRQEETLKAENKKKFRLSMFIEGTKELFKFKETLLFTVISAFITGGFMVYLSSSQYIFENQYGLVDEFPYIFAGLALTIGGATFINGSLVMKLGMRKLVQYALIFYCLVSITYVIIFWSGANPSITILMIFMALQFASIGFLFGNTGAIAMEPIGHIAGLGAAIIGFFSTILAVPIAMFIGQFIKDTTLPMFIGFSICGIMSLLLFFVSKKKYPQ